MSLVFTEEQEMLRASARNFLQNECPEGLVRQIELLGSGYSPELWQKIAELGWLGLVFPAQFGGFEMNYLDLTVLCEELGRAIFPGPYIPTVVFGGLTILKVGNEEQKSTVLPRIVEGNEIITMVLDEPGSLSQAITYSPYNVTIRAIPQGDDFVLNGRTLLVPDAEIATKLLVPARTMTYDDPNYGITVFLVPAGIPGITITRLASLAGDNPCEVAFSNVRVSRNDILGKQDNGWPPLSRSIHIGTMMFSAQMLGAGERMLRITTDDYETRIKSNESARDIQTEEYLHNLGWELEDCRLATYEAASKLNLDVIFKFEDIIVDSWKIHAAEKS
jgi:alkylation response protein AidB-like acyl-CoA dehydrogenase